MLFLLGERKCEQKLVKEKFLFGTSSFCFVQKKEGTPRYDFWKATAVSNYGKNNSEDLKMIVTNNMSFMNYVQSTQDLGPNQSPI